MSSREYEYKILMGLMVSIIFLMLAYLDCMTRVKALRSSSLRSQFYKA